MIVANPSSSVFSGSTPPPSASTSPTLHPKIVSPTSTSHPHTTQGVGNTFTHVIREIEHSDPHGYTGTSSASKRICLSAGAEAALGRSSSGGAPLGSASAAATTRPPKTGTTTSSGTDHYYHHRPPHIPPAGGGLATPQIVLDSSLSPPTTSGTTPLTQIGDNGLYGVTLGSRTVNANTSTVGAYQSYSSGLPLDDTSGACGTGRGANCTGRVSGSAAGSCMHLRHTQEAHKTIQPLAQTLHIPPPPSATTPAAASQLCLPNLYHTTTPQENNPQALAVCTPPHPVPTAGTNWATVYGGAPNFPRQATPAGSINRVVGSRGFVHDCHEVGIGSVTGGGGVNVAPTNNVHLPGCGSSGRYHMASPTGGPPPPHHHSQTTGRDGSQHPTSSQQSLGGGGVAGGGRYVCRVCETFSFHNYDDMMRHEAECQLQHPTHPGLHGGHGLGMGPHVPPHLGGGTPHPYAQHHAGASMPYGGGPSGFQYGAASGGGSSRYAPQGSSSSVSGGMANPTTVTPMPRQASFGGGATSGYHQGSDHPGAGGAGRYPHSQAVSFSPSTAAVGGQGSSGIGGTSGGHHPGSPPMFPSPQRTQDNKKAAASGTAAVPLIEPQPLVRHLNVDDIHRLSAVDRALVESIVLFTTPDHEHQRRQQQQEQGHLSSERKGTPPLEGNRQGSPQVSSTVGSQGDGGRNAGRGHKSDKDGESSSQTSIITPTTPAASKRQRLAEAQRSHQEIIGFQCKYCMESPLATMGSDGGEKFDKVYPGSVESVGATLELVKHRHFCSDQCTVVPPKVRRAFLTAASELENDRSEKTLQQSRMLQAACERFCRRGGVENRQPYKTGIIVRGSSALVLGEDPSSSTSRRIASGGMVEYERLKMVEEDPREGARRSSSQQGWGDTAPSPGTNVGMEMQQAMQGMSRNLSSSSMHGGVGQQSQSAPFQPSHAMQAYGGGQHGSGGSMDPYNPAAGMGDWSGQQLASSSRPSGTGLHIPQQPPYGPGTSYGSMSNTSSYSPARQGGGGMGGLQQDPYGAGSVPPSSQAPPSGRGVAAAASLGGPTTFIRDPTVGTGWVCPHCTSTPYHLRAPGSYSRDPPGMDTMEQHFSLCTGLAGAMSSLGSAGGYGAPPSHPPRGSAVTHGQGQYGGPPPPPYGAPVQGYGGPPCTHGGGGVGGWPSSVNQPGAGTPRGGGMMHDHDHMGPPHQSMGGAPDYGMDQTQHGGYSQLPQASHQGGAGHASPSHIPVHQPGSNQSHHHHSSSSPSHPREAIAGSMTAPPASGPSTGGPRGTHDSTRAAAEFLAAQCNRSDYDKDPEALVLPEDKLLLTEYFYFLNQQLKLCRFTEKDRKTRGGKRENIEIGYGGLECRHCAGETGSRKFFWSDVDRLANSFAEIPSHIMKCRKCPDEVKAALQELKTRHPEQMAKLPRGSQKVFFRRMWRRLHPNGETSTGRTSKSPPISTSPRMSIKRSASGEEKAVRRESVKSQPPSSSESMTSQGPASATTRRRSTEVMVSTSAEAGSPGPSPGGQHSIITVGSGDEKRVLLAISEDKQWLSDLDCFIRRSLEAFCASETDVTSNLQDRRYPIKLGQVGIRCVHCACTATGASGAAVNYPYSINGIYETVREFQRLHLDKCPNLPSEERTRLEHLKTSASLSSVLRRYYVIAAKALGMYDTTDGIRSEGGSIPNPSGASQSQPPPQQQRPLDLSPLKFQGERGEAESDAAASAGPSEQEGTSDELGRRSISPEHSDSQRKGMPDERPGGDP